MRILMIEPYVDVDANLGDSTHVKEVATNLSELGFHITLIARSSRRKFRSRPNLEFKNVSLTNEPIKGMNLSKAVSAVYAFLMGFTILLTSKVDVIHERQPFPVGLVLGKMFGVATITEVNGLLVNELDSEEFDALRKTGLYFVLKKVVAFFEKAILRSTDRIITVTFSLKEMLEQVYGIPKGKVFVLHNGVNVNLFRPIGRAKELLGYDKNCNYVCFVGNLNKPYFGLECLIESASLVLKVFPKARFLIVGDGLLRKGLENRVKKLGLANDFNFTGKVDYDDVPLYINASDVCCALFAGKRNEKIGLSPLKLYEYLACGKAVVGTNVKGVGDLLTESNSGISVPPENPKELAKAIVTLLKDGRLARKMGENGRQAVINEYSWMTVAEKLANFLINVKNNVSAKYDSIA